MVKAHSLEFAGRKAALVTALDITERKRVEEVTEESQEKYRTLIEQSNDAIYLIYGNKFEIINRKFEELFGVSQAAANAPDFVFTNIVAPKSRTQVMERARKEREGQNLSPRYEFTALDKEGHEIEVELTVSYPTYRGGLATQGVLRDITERKRLQEQLLQAQKMEAIGRLAGGVAHDFNNLLTVINGYSELLLLRYPDPHDPIRREIEQIRKAGARATGLTRQLLAFSRKQVLQPQLLDLDDLVADVGKMLQRLIGEDIELITIPRPGLGQVKADPGQIEQVIMNLAINARDAMPQGGKLTIETANVRLDEGYTRQHTEVKPGPYVMLAVSDSGIGMDKETQARIFEPFFTTKTQGRGTGLGLAAVYGIVKQSGGHIWVYSEVGRGTTFKVYLPQIEEMVETPQPSVAPSQLPQGSETILLVEDEEGVREFIFDILRASGYTVLEARNGREALMISKRYSGAIHLLLTDVVMPEMSGRELVGYLASLRPQMKVLYMSGYTDDAIVRHGVLEPGRILLQKPFTPYALTRRIREVLDTSE